MNEMDNIEDEIERRIALLEEEVSFALFPVTRDGFLQGKLNISEEKAKSIGIDLEWRRNNASLLWLNYLRSIKREKDGNTEIWQRMKNWD